MRTVERLAPFETTIFDQMSQLATRCGAINLGQGFPDTDGPESLLDAARAAIMSGQNQYPPGSGVLELREAVSDHQKTHYGVSYCPDTEILVTVGATEAIAASIVGLVEPGGEVVMIEPFYDSYAAATAMAGAVRKTVPLVPHDNTFILDVNALTETVSDRTDVLIINSPHNPTGTNLGNGDLQAIADICIKHDVLVISDEVYEHLVFDDQPHRTIASYPGMQERTIRISSAAKTFNITGWKVGWLSGPQKLVTAARTAKQYMSFSAGAPLQPAVAAALRHEMEWVELSKRNLQRKRDLFTTALTNMGFQVHPAQGTYYVCVDVRSLDYPSAEALCWEMPTRIGVAAVPVSAFTDNAGPWSQTLRFAIAKRDSTLLSAIERLSTL